MTNFKGISKIKKDKANKIKIETDLVNQYKNAITNLFKTVSFEKDSFGNRNNFYYSDTISNFSNSITKEYLSNKELNSLKEIEIFNRTTIDLLNDIVQFFIAIDNYDSQNNKVVEDICLTKTNIDDGFTNLGQFDLIIKDYFTKNDSSIAMKEYCLNLIKKSLYFLNNSLYIFIDKCPLKSDYDNLKYNLEHSISRQDIELSQVFTSNSKKNNVKFKESNFTDFIHNVNNKMAFSKELKETFDTERGIDFKIMIELLKEQKIFRISERKFKSFYDLVTKYFDRDIGGYSGLNDRYKHTEADKKAQPQKIRNIEAKLQPLIDKYKNK